MAEEFNFERADDRPVFDEKPARKKKETTTVMKVDKAAKLNLRSTPCDDDKTNVVKVLERGDLVKMTNEVVKYNGKDFVKVYVGDDTTGYVVKSFLAKA